MIATANSVATVANVIGFDGSIYSDDAVAIRVVSMQPAANEFSPLEALAQADGFLDDEGFFCMSDDEFLSDARITLAS
jgi:hypothetical protein